MNTEHEFFPVSPGVELAVLRQHDGGGGGLTFLVRMEKGARAPRHDHPGGEETFVLAGALRIVARRSAAHLDEPDLPDLLLRAGEHGWVPPGERHEGIAEGEEG